MADSERDLDPLVDALPARFVVGIDLGTTNSAVAYVDTQERPWQLRNFLIPQVVAPRQVESRETLPSFHYQATASEAAEGIMRLPWSTQAPSYAVGVWAREEGVRTAGRLIASAKSWLCHSGVDRSADLLPWHAAPDVERLSPVEVSSRYLAHIRDAWNAAFPQEELARQEIVLTLPASFDEIARELTVQAAARAGLPKVVLIEEPQAAFYAWVYKHREDWHQRVAAGQKILICDIGGGTSDFTLLRVRQGKIKSSQVEFHRVAVGDHLILGGDNLDLTLARHVEQALAGTGRIEPRQWDVLVRICRHAKETLLADDAPETFTVHIPAFGARLIGGGLRHELNRDATRTLLMDGFLPRNRFDEKPVKRQSGFQEFGLPFASDPGITRYLAQFLLQHQHAGAEHAGMSDADVARPDIVLFNGGFFASRVLRDRLLEVLASWFRGTAGASDWNPVVLDPDRLDLAVARGAAYYGMVRRGEGVRITANLARSYYVGVESDPPAGVCLLPGDTAPGEHVELTDRTFSLTIAQPVEFPLYVSSTRLTDRPGALVPFNSEQMRALPPIGTVLRTQRRSETGTVPVRLHAQLSEIGTIDLWCSELDSPRKWRLQFDVRTATRTDMEGHLTASEAAGFVDEETWTRCETRIAAVYAAGAAGTSESTATSDSPASPEGLMKRLAEELESPRSEWPPSLLRRIWESLMDKEAGRRRSAAHESRWLNLVGFSLRPGYGLAVDDWRVAETWRKVRGKLVFPAVATRIESLILWRRIAGGLSAGQQRALADPILSSLRELGRRALEGRQDRSKGAVASEAIETWCLLGSLELLPISNKREIGDLIVALLERNRLAAHRNAMLWGLGRIGQRVPAYGPLNSLVPVESVHRWLETLLSFDGSNPVTQLTVMQLARRTDDRYRDISEGLRREAIDWLRKNQAPDHLVELVSTVGRLDSEEQARVMGESLPKGLRIL